MSEKTPMQQTQTQADFLHWLKCSSEWNARIALRDARDRKAEAAEAYLEWILDTPTSSALEDHKIGLRLHREYVAAREAVRKLEEDKR